MLPLYVEPAEGLQACVLLLSRHPQSLSSEVLLSVHLLSLLLLRRACRF